MSLKFKPVGLPDSLYLTAAEGWLELGMPLEAQAELVNLTPSLRIHPLVLELQWNIHAQTGQWELASGVSAALATLLPEDSFGWIHRAYSLHELKRTREAWDVLLPMADKFPDQYIIRYNLACYACQLDNLKESLVWLKRAMALAGKKDVRIMALEDPDLKPLWPQIGKL